MKERLTPFGRSAAPTWNATTNIASIESSVRICRAIAAIEMRFNLGNKERGLRTRAQGGEGFSRGHISLVHM